MNDEENSKGKQGVFGGGGEVAVELAGKKRAKRFNKDKANSDNADEWDEDGAEIVSEVIAQARECGAGRSEEV